MKPVKPTPDFPLFPHACGKWAKKIKGRMVYFGRWDDPAGALAAYKQSLQTDTVAVVSRGFTLRDACNDFMDAKLEAKEAGNLSPSTYGDYYRSCKRFIEFVGADTLVRDITPSHFSQYRASLASKVSVITTGNQVTAIRILFGWCYEQRLIATPMHFGQDFKRASKKQLRKHRRLAGKKLYTAAQIRRLLDEAGIHMKAMLLLAINCGYGNSDCSNLPLSAVDLDKAWIDYPRPKTEIDRSCPLWPETIKALRRSLKRRYKALPEFADRFFVTAGGRAYDVSGAPIAKRFRVLRDWSGIKTGGFYWLRHTFETVAGDSKDQVAVNAVMGHADNSMAANYREEISQSRLKAVTSHVRKWLFRGAKSKELNSEPSDTAS